MQFFDAHTHVHFPAYGDDVPEVMRRAKEAGVKMITVGTQFSTSVGAIAVANEYPEDAWATVGFHPNHLSTEWFHDKKEQAEDKPEAFDYEKMLALVRDPKVVAVGECGLDYFRSGEETKKRQQEVFEQHIDISKATGKPLMIHCRDAFGDSIEILRSRRADLLPGVVHFFTGTPEDAKNLLDLGFSFTFGGVVTFPPKADQPPAGAYSEVIKMIPMDRILSETDAPYVAPVPYRGKRNEPAYVVEVVKKLAELKEVSTEKMAEQIFQNAKRIFRV